MIEGDERGWKAAVEDRRQNARAKAFRQHICALFLIVSIVPAAFECAIVVGEAIRAPGGFHSISRVVGSMVWIYCAILLWSLPITIPVGISHVAYAAFLYGRGYLNWFSAAIGGFAHGIAAVLLMAVFYSHDKGWPQFGALISFGLAGTVIALILHAVIPLYRRSGRRATAP